MKPVWPRLADMHLNTVLAPVSWEWLEPQEGKFDDTLVDGLIKEARAHRLRLVFLWFGSWKNTYSSYAPEWVNIDFVSPDIYFPDFINWASLYHRDGNPLFVPEAISDQTAANAFYAVGNDDYLQRMFNFRPDGWLRTGRAPGGRASRWLPRHC